MLISARDASVRLLRRSLYTALAISSSFSATIFKRFLSCCSLHAIDCVFPLRNVVFKPSTVAVTVAAIVLSESAVRCETSCAARRILNNQLTKLLVLYVGDVFFVVVHFK